VAAATGLKVGTAPEALKITQRPIAYEPHVAAAASVAPVRSPTRHVGLTPEAQATIAAGPSLHVNARVILHALML
jgi:hypothetical protein